MEDFPGPEVFAPIAASKDTGASRLSALWRPRMTLAEREARGRTARRESPRSSHRRWLPAPDRPDPIALLEEQAQTRVPELVPIRYGRMLVSPFTFYRGAALIMAADLATTPRSGITVQLCGDAHLSNFGLFGTPERNMFFDINDFDETLPGPWEWDVKRLSASFEIDGRARGFAPADRRAIVLAGVREYRNHMRRAAGMGALDAWYDHANVGQLLDQVRDELRRNRLGKREVRNVQRIVAEAATRDSVHVYAKSVREVGGEPRIVAEPPLIVPVEDLVAQGTFGENFEVIVAGGLEAYRRTLPHELHPIEEFRYVHAARKVVGVGSVGTRCYILLMEGVDRNAPLFLQIKQAEASVLERFLGKSAYDQHGERVVAGQRLMQAASDIFLGWVRAKEHDGQTRDYYIRQLQDRKGGLNVDRALVPGLRLYARICGATLARAHARWGDRIAIAAYLGTGDTFDQAIADFSAAYADQNERDYAAFVAAVRTGRLAAQVGV
jgi:uncharacterized protein (DUF2252 family)